MLARTPSPIAAVAAFNTELQAAQTALAKKYGLTLAPVKVEWHMRAEMYYDEEMKVNSRHPDDRLPHLQTIADSWDWNKFNLPKTTPRPQKDGSALLDGAGTHRALGLVEDHNPQYRNILIPTHVVLGDEDRSTPKAIRAAYKKEADVFVGIATATKKLGAANIFIGELIAGADEACSIRDEMKKLGVAVPNQLDGTRIPSWPEGFKTIPIMRVLHREGVLSKAMLTARKVWAAESDSMLRHGMAATAALYLTFPNIDDERLRKVLALHPYSEVQHSPPGKAFTGAHHGYEIMKPLAHLYLDYYDTGDYFDKNYGGSLGGLVQAKKLGGSGGEGKRYKRDLNGSGARYQLDETCNRLIHRWKGIKQPAGEE